MTDREMLLLVYAQLGGHLSAGPVEPPPPPPPVDPTKPPLYTGPIHADLDLPPFGYVWQRTIRENEQIAVAFTKTRAGVTLRLQGAPQWYKYVTDSIPGWRGEQRIGAPQIHNVDISMVPVGTRIVVLFKVSGNPITKAGNVAATLVEV